MFLQAIQTVTDSLCVSEEGEKASFCGMLLIILATRRGYLASLRAFTFHYFNKE